TKRVWALFGLDFCLSPTKKGEFAGVGSENPLKSNFVSGFKLSVQRTARFAEFTDKFNKGLIY
ncbi:hypothetical protein, partial [Microcoleus sp. herbarium2]|uniref:hypothetical protein n=1 Tax=Microcoleus sp. herbarium2 TaxID=3055433 RepID=UPI002FD35314